VELTAHIRSEFGRESPFVNEVVKCAIEAISHGNHPCFKSTTGERAAVALSVGGAPQFRTG